MIPYLDCRAAQDRLDAFIDGELSVDEQVAVEWHLRWCGVCDMRRGDMRLVGDALRDTACALRQGDLKGDPLACLPSSIGSRLMAERDQALRSRVSGWCADMRLFWPAVGASLALVACLAVARAVVSVTSDERPDSLAGLIDVLANPGSNQNPVPLDVAIIAPPRALDGATLEALPGDEAVFALSAVVTREGRVANYELLLSERASVRRHDTAVETADANVVLDAVKQSRFSPAQASDGAPVAVNLVWVLARTTVRGSSERPEDRLESPPAPMVTTTPAPIVHPEPTELPAAEPGPSTV